MIKKCVVCGKKFYTRNARKTCSAMCFSKRREQYGTHRTDDTLCWSCQNATGGCNWSRALKPVEGWSATPIKIKRFENEYMDSYKITSCPEYEEDEVR